MARSARSRIAAVVAIAATVALGAGLAPTARAQDDAGSKVVFTMANDQEVDSLNINVGVLVIDYEIWNLQFLTLTDKSDKDFSVIPGLATSWESSDDGLTWTYTLAPDLKWSDGEALTAEDVAYTVNRGRDEEWAALSGIVDNLTATAIDATTLELETSVPDPRLPIMDAFILPKHIYEDISADDMATYEAEDGVGSGPFHVVEHKRGQFVRMERNENFAGTPPVVDEIIFRYFASADSAVTALERGEVDAVETVPADLVSTLETNDDIEIIEGNQGGFSELAMNAGDGHGDGHPALADPVVRRAINFAIDRDVLVDKVLRGRGTAGTTISPSASPTWDLDVSALDEADVYTFDLDKANALLDDAGYEDADGDGVREMNDGSGTALKFRLYQLSDSDTSPATIKYFESWFGDIGVALEVKSASSDQLTAIIGEGTYDMFLWGWVPFVDPDPMYSYFICEQISDDPESPGYNDGNWCEPEYDALYDEQHIELDQEKRRAIGQELLGLFYTEGPYAVLYKYNDIQAYRRDRWTGVTRQPAETGPVFFTNSSHSYRTLAPVEGSSGGGSSAAIIVAIVVAGVLIAATIVLVARRKRTSDDRQ